MSSTDCTSRTGRGWVAVFFIALVAQFYGSFYLGWFAGVALAIALIFSLPVRDYRARLWFTLRSHAAGFCVWGTLAAAALFVMARSYLQVAAITGYASAVEVQFYAPHLGSWWSRGPQSWFDLTRFLVRMHLLDNTPWPDGEHYLGLGPITYAVAVFGLARLCDRRIVLLLFATAMTLCVSVTTFWPGMSLWPYISPCIPGAGAIRTVGRVALVTLIPIALCAAWAIQRISERQSLLAFALATLCILEQARKPVTYGVAEHRRTVAAIAHCIPAGTVAFFIGPTHHLPTAVDRVFLQLDAMWAALATGVPTINGYSGKEPPGWPVMRVPDPEAAVDERTMGPLLKEWLPGRGRWLSEKELKIYLVSSPDRSR